MNKRQIFKTIKSLEGFNKSIEHDSFEKSKKNADKPFQKYEFLGDRVLGLIISEYLITTFSHNTLDEISRRFIHLVNTNTLAKIFRKNNLGDIFKHQLDPNSNKNSINLWIVSDNLLRGAALTAVEIAETYYNKLQ